MLAAGLSTQAKVILGVVALAFIAFALISSFVLPRSRPDFPGKKGLRAYLIVAVLFFVAMMLTVILVAKEPKESKAATATGAATTTTTASTDAGKKVFTSAGCASCHTLKDAGATGTVGPNLDEKKPPYALVVDRVTHGKGVMPSFSSRLSATDIQNVAKYVSTVAGT